MPISNRGLLCGVLIGGVLLLLGGIMFPVVDKIIHDKIIKEVLLSDTNSIGYKAWFDPPGDVYTQVWFFTLVNKAEVKQGQKPVFVERGPYTFKTIKTRDNIVYSHDKETMNFTTPTTYFFLPDMSIGDLQDKITTVNVPLVTTAEIMKYMNPILQKIVLDIVASVEDEEVFYERTVQDLLCGYEDPLLKLAHEVLPDLVPDPHFGFLYGRNGTNDGVYEIYTGAKDITQTGNIVSWQGMTELDWWSTPEANAINGTDGTYSHPFWSKDDDAYTFNPIVGRSVGVTYERESTFRDIPIWRYSLPDYFLMNGTTYPPNAGFCLPDIHHCLPNGLLNISKILYGCPAIMSLPHFLLADKDQVQDLVYGLNPDPTQHNSHINVEPHLGITLEADVRIQINIYMEKFPQIEQLKSLPTLTFPIMWLNESWVTSTEFTDYVRSHFTVLMLIADVAKWCLIALGGVLLVTFLVIYIQRRLSISYSVLNNASNGVINSTNGDIQASTNETTKLVS